MKNINMPRTINLDGQWKFAFDDNEHCFVNINDIEKSNLPNYECIVPGNFELDLYSNGIIDDPFFGINISKLFKYEKYRIWYYRRFNAYDHNDFIAELVFQGLDCIADIFLNGELISSIDNMLIEHRIDVTKKLLFENEIIVHIKPAIIEAMKYDYPSLLAGISDSNCASLYIRKAPHMYGWDIMPKAVSAGIWRSVLINYKPKEHFLNNHLETISVSEDKTYADLVLGFQLASVDVGSSVYEIEISGKCQDSIIYNKKIITFAVGLIRFRVDNPLLWWPKGRGLPNLYDIKISILKNGTEIDNIKFKYGIRTVKLNKTSLTDRKGSGEFCFIINNEKVFILGTNWVPADVYHSRDKERIPNMLRLADDIGCNMIRCWGGNVYECDDFYDICDSMGIMIWQDFSMACAIYPQDYEFNNRFAAEVRSVVRRLRHHPSVVLWSGDNECDMVWSMLGKDPNDNIITRNTIPAVLKEEDRSRPYLPSSPYIDQKAYANGSIDMSEDHLWGPRDFYKSDFYKNSIAHFASEIGYHGCPSPESIKKFISKEKLWPYKNNDEWILHSTSPIPGIDLFDYRVELMAKQIDKLFGFIPDNLDDFSFASQISQSEAKKFFIEMFRLDKWRKTGIIWWNLIDGWPQFSDAVVDYYYNKKLAYNTIKRSQNPICVMLTEPKNKMQNIIITNDTRFNYDVSCKIYNIDTNDILFENKINAKPNNTSIFGNIDYASDKQNFYIIEYECCGNHYINHYLAGEPPFNYEMVKEWYKRINNGI